MKVYFTAAIYQRGQLKQEYTAIMDAIEKLGHAPCTSFDVMNQTLEVLKNTQEEVEDFYQHWTKVISHVDIGVVECSFPSSVHIGMEIASLLDRGKPVICLYTKGRNPIFTGEFHSSRLLKLEYSKENIHEVLKWGLDEMEQIINRRFTFFINPEIDTYLEKVSKKKGLSKSELLRDMIEKEIKNKQ